MHRKLKILFVLQFPWVNTLGVSKVHYTLKTEYEKHGHLVDYLDINKLKSSKIEFIESFFGLSYQEKILAYLKANALNYDVIDANCECIPFSKSEYNFKGLVICRSHGLLANFQQLLQTPQYKKMSISLLGTKTTLRTKLGDFYRSLKKKYNTDDVAWLSILNADIVHTLNIDDFNYLINFGIKPNKLALIPNGLDLPLLGKFNELNLNEKTEISFIGSWRVPKGILDLPYIFEKLEKHGVEKFNLIGTGYDHKKILSFFPKALHSKINIITHFSNEELGSILNKTKLGIFPSYSDGFGLAIVEQLSFRVPVVAYAIQGPKDILSKVTRSKLLCALGDKDELISNALNVWKMNNERYDELAHECKVVSSEYAISIVSKAFIDLYQSNINL